MNQEFSCGQMQKRRCIANWEFLASVRQGVPPQGIEAELQAWMNQYPDSWLVVDLRDE